MDLRVLLFSGLLLSTISSMAFPVVENGGFEADLFSKYPGYASEHGGVITSWRYTEALGGNGSGVWHQDDEAWANNGIFPEGVRHFFAQFTFGNTGKLSQIVGGFLPGRRYFLHYDVNMRDFPGNDPILWPNISPKATVVVTLGGVEIDRFENFGSVEPRKAHTRPWYHRTARSVDGATASQELVFTLSIAVPSIVGEGSPVIDNIHFVQDPPDPNTPPIVTPVEDQRVSPGTRLQIHLSAMDTNEPAQQLKFAVDPAVNAAEVNDLGDFTFDAAPDSMETNIPIRVIVWDNGVPSRTNSFNFVLSVIPDRLKLESVTANAVQLSWPSVPGERYWIEGTGSLASPRWKEVTGEIVADSARTVTVISGSTKAGQQLFRLKRVR